MKNTICLMAILIIDAYKKMYSLSIIKCSHLCKIMYATAV